MTNQTLYDIARKVEYHSYSMIDWWANSETYVVSLHGLETLLYVMID